MPKIQRKQKKPTKSRRSRSTKKLSASTPTFSRTLSSTHKSAKHQSLANELYVQSLSARLNTAAPQEAVVEGVSMWPTLRPGYRVRYCEIDCERISPGDILVIRAEGRRGESQLRVHRLLGRVGPLFLEAGDNAYAASLVTAEAILGKVEAVVDWEGRPIPLPAYVPSELPLRFRYFLFWANGFMFTHEWKNRMVGGRKSLWLWRVSAAYRASLAALGVRVPTLLKQR